MKENSENIKDIDAGNETKEIVDIEMDNICHFYLWKNVRDSEKFEQLKNDIVNHGLNEPIIVRPKNGKYETIIGNHRLEAYKQLGRKSIPCIVKDWDDKKSTERYLADNLNRTNHSAIELEEIVYDMKCSGNYKNNGELAFAISYTPQRIGQLLTSKEERDKFNKMLEKEGSKESLDVGTQVLLDARYLTDENQRFELLKLIQKKKIGSNETKRVAKTLENMDVKVRNRILYGKEDFYKVMAQRDANYKPLRESQTKTVYQAPYDFTIDLYDKICRNLSPYMDSLEYSSNGMTEINYLKMTIAVMVLELFRHGYIEREEFKQIKKILGIFRDELYGYDGDPFEKYGGGVESFV